MPTSEPCAAQEPAAVYLCPGQLFASAVTTSVTTIVGSCVAVGLWDPAAGVGGVCHFQLPRWLGTGPRTQSYADVALQELLERIRLLGGGSERLRASLFGGACLTPHVPRRHRALGEENLEQALAHLREYSIPVVEAVTGGCRGRKVVFRTGDGHAVVDPL